MKLSDYKGEAALDKLSEIIEPRATMFGDPQMQEIAKSKGAPIKYAKPILKDHKPELIEILAALENESVEVFREKITLLTLPAKLIEFLNDPEVQALFPQQSQKQNSQPDFGSVMANTGEGEN